MTTIRDIAREAGVSVSTVSRVIGGHPDVSDRTAERVQEVIEKRQFTVNRSARNLKQMETMTILALIKGRNNMLFASMLEHVQEAVNATGFTLTTQSLDEDDNEVAEAERLVLEIKPRGVVFLGCDQDHIRTHARRVGESCPAVVLTNAVTDRDRPFISSVTTDDSKTSHDAVDYLISRGHRRIAVIGGDPRFSTMSSHRQSGVIAALNDNGLPFNPETHYVGTRYSLECGYRATESLMRTATGFTAIYAMSDIMALGAMRALADHGLRVPDDVSLVGHDGIELASYLVPKLVTIRQPQQFMATRGIEILMGHINGDSTPIEEFLPAEILVGESVRTIAKG